MCIGNFLKMSVLVFSVSGFISCTKIRKKEDIESQVKFDSIVTDSKGNETVVVFEIDQYLGMQRLCVILSTINKQQLVKEGKATDLTGKLVPDELTRDLFKKRRQEWTSFIDEKLKNQLFPDSATEDFAWENLVLHLRHGTSRSVGFGPSDEAHPVNLAGFAKYLKLNAGSITIGAEQAKALNEKWQEAGRTTLANLILGVVGAGMYAAAAPYVIGGVLGLSAVQFGWIFIEERNSAKAASKFLAQSKLQSVLPSVEDVAEEHGKRLLADPKEMPANDVYQTFSDLLSKFSKTGKSEFEIIASATVPEKVSLKNLYMERLFEIHQPVLFKETCPKNLGQADSLRDLLTR